MIIHQLVSEKVEHPLSLGEDLHLTECQQITDNNQKSESVPPKKAGSRSQWCRSMLSVAQVVAISGAGEVFRWGPAPRKWFLCAVMAQVTRHFPHLRHAMKVNRTRRHGRC
jgi:hypothetical protein